MAEEERAAADGEAEPRRVSLRIRAGAEGGDGLLFTDIPVSNLSCTLRDFLDSALKDLESQSLLQLPATDDGEEVEENDGCLVNPRTFKVFNEEMTRELDLSLPLSDHQCIVSGLMTGVPLPVLVCQSDIFMSSHQLAIEELVKLRKTDSIEPEVPPRGSSLTATGLMSKEEIVYLAGRKDPTSIKRMKRDVSNVSLASSCRDSSEGGSPALNLLNDEATERLLFDSISVDSASTTHSAGSTSVTVATMDTSPAPAAQPDEGGGVTTRGSQFRRKKVLSSSRRRSKPPPSLSFDRTPDTTEGTNESKSLPNTPVAAGMELGQNRIQTSESDSQTSPVSKNFTSPEASPNKHLGPKVRVTATISLPPPLTVIEEPVDEEGERGVVNGGGGEGGERVRARSPSPSLVPPSPRRVGFSPSSTKRRMAGRRGSRCPVTYAYWAHKAQMPYKEPTLKSSQSI